MNSLVIKSSKHQDNNITFSKTANGVFVSGNGIDNWQQRRVLINEIPLKEATIKVLRGKGDNDVTLTIETVEYAISVVIGSPEFSGDIYNSKEIYGFFDKQIIGNGDLHDSLMAILNNQ